MTGFVTIMGNPIIYPGGSDTIGPLQVSAPNPVLQVNSLTFPTGEIMGPIYGPFGATALIIVPPTGNIIGLSLKGLNTDVGIPLSPNQPTGPITFFSNASNVQNFVYIGAAAAVTTGNVSLTWF